MEVIIIILINNVIIIIIITIIITIIIKGYLLSVGYSPSVKFKTAFVESATIANTQQAQQFGKVLMLSIYAFTMAYLFQAAPERNEDSLLDRTVYYY